MEIARTAAISATGDTVEVAVGSSARTIAGSPTMARAIATRCRSPPESCRGWCVSRCTRPTRWSARQLADAAHWPRDPTVEQPLGDVVERRKRLEKEELLEDESQALTAEPGQLGVTRARRSLLRRPGPDPRSVARACP